MLIEKAKQLRQTSIFITPYTLKNTLNGDNAKEGSEELESSSPKFKNMDKQWHIQQSTVYVYNMHTAW